MIIVRIIVIIIVEIILFLSILLNLEQDEFCLMLVLVKGISNAICVKNIEWCQPFAVVGNHHYKTQSYFVLLEANLLDEAIHVPYVFMTSVLDRNRCTYFN